MTRDFREINGSQNSLDLHFKNKPQIVPEQEPSIEEKVPTTFQKLGGKNDDAQKFQVYLSAECNIYSWMENIIDKNQGNNTEAMKPLSIKPKEHASIFKTKNINTSKQGCKKPTIITTEKRRRLVQYKCKTQKKLEFTFIQRTYRNNFSTFYLSNRFFYYRIIDLLSEN